MIRPIGAIFLVLTSCSAAPSTPANAGGDAGDAAPACAENLPESGTSCVLQPAVCFYDYVMEGPRNVPNERCDCLQPEAKWNCCNAYTPLYCDARHIPVDGEPCCAGDVRLGGSYGCNYCALDGTGFKCLCAHDDHHWRCQPPTDCPVITDSGTSVVD